MRYQNVCVEALTYTLPPHVVTSVDIEEQLAPVYDGLGMSVGRLELMTGIRERRFFPPGTSPGHVSATTANDAIEASKIDRRHFGCLIHGSVCRDQMEPATACGVHYEAGMPGDALVLDVSNACLGILNGVMILANMIELGQIRAGVVVGTETGRDLVEGTIDSLLRNPDVTRKDVKLAFASLTIGSGSAAIVLCDRKLSQTGNRLLGGEFRADSESHHLCMGDSEIETHGDGRPRMLTDAEALLHAGIDLAAVTWERTKLALNWTNESVDKAFTHQVGKAHKKLLYERLDLNPHIDFSTMDFLGNTGAAALPTAAAIGIERKHVQAGDQVALLGIGSGLNAIMLGMHWLGHP